MAAKLDPRAGLVVAVVSVSTASIFIKWSEAPALAIAAYRLGFATLLLLVPTLLLNRRELLALSRREVAILSLVGVALAFHFAFWISSLKYTTVANSVILVSTHPILIAAISHRYGGGLSPREGAGIGVALAGILLIGSGDLTLDPASLLGDALALLGMFALAAYLLSGRRLRQRIAVLPYALVVYAAATAALFGGSLALGVPLYPYPQREWILFLALAIVPMILGHTVYNWTLRYVSALLVSMSILGEPILSSVLAVVLLNEVPSAWVIAGGALVLLGIYLVASRGRG